MNAALLRESEPTGAMQMSANEKDNLPVQVAELRADVRHLQSDMTELKTELRATNQRLDSLNQRLNERIDEIKDSLASAKVWALGLYFAQAGSLLYAMARGFKWL